MTGPARPPQAATDATDICVAAAAMLLTLVVPAALAAAIDERTLAGIDVWIKPLKFDLSLALHLATVAWATTLLPPDEAARPPARLAALTCAFTALAEALYIALQAARGRDSHFNVSTPWEATVYFAGMGGAAVLLVASTFMVGWLVWRRGDPRAGVGVRLGAAAGLMIGSAATLVVAGALSSGAFGGLGHWIGGERSDVTGLPIFGWSTTGGDLRVAHFFATHLMQALPVVGWLADRFDPTRPRRWLAVAAATGVGVVAATFLQAIAGRPFL